jgi:hypothetical protein
MSGGGVRVRQAPDLPNEIEHLTEILKTESPLDSMRVVDKLPSGRLHAKPLGLIAREGRQIAAWKRSSLVK